MTHRQLRRALKRLHLTQLRLARVVRVDPRTVRSWVADRSRTPHTIGLLLAAWEFYPGLIPQPPRPRGKKRRTA